MQRSLVDLLMPMLHNQPQRDGAASSAALALKQKVTQTGSSAWPTPGEGPRLWGAHSGRLSSSMSEPSCRALEPASTRLQRRIDQLERQLRQESTLPTPKRELHGSPSAPDLINSGGARLYEFQQRQLQRTQSRKNAQQAVGHPSSQLAMLSAPRDPACRDGDGQEERPSSQRPPPPPPEVGPWEAWKHDKWRPPLRPRQTLQQRREGRKLAIQKWREEQREFGRVRCSDPRNYILPPPGYRAPPKPPTPLPGPR